LTPFSGARVEYMVVGARHLLLGVAADDVHAVVLRRRPCHFAARDRQRRGLRPCALRIGLRRRRRRHAGMAVFGMAVFGMAVLGADRAASLRRQHRGTAGYQKTAS
jgi:hypothetical protein